MLRAQGLLRRQSEMMAVYRDSLWLHTPTPLKARLAHHACSRGGRTPLQPLSENRSPAAGSRWADSPYDLSDSFIATGAFPPRSRTTRRHM